MKLKYYLRGLGIGIIVSSLIFTISGSTRTEKLSDDEIMERAQELGMVTEDHATQEDAEDASNKKDSETQDENAEDASGDTAENTQDQKAASTDTENSDVQTADSQDSNKIITIKIAGGEFSDAVCSKLKEAGLIMDADSFNKYLISNNYDSMLHSGNYDIPEGATEEEIAQILISKQ